jgi:RimJ/RimL family protein N-acetyltransferase
MKYLYYVKKTSDFDAYLKIKSDPTAILWSGFTCAPNPDKLLNHFVSLIQNDKIYLFYLVDDETNTILGYCRINYIDETTCESDGVSILSEFQGKGLGNEIHCLKKLKAKELGFLKMIGCVSENNIPSKKNMENNGWILVDGVEYRRIEAFQRTDKFLHYEVVL